ncbi:MAG TPA: hypothetical protein VF366_01540 [Dehalococcoidia bacterium]|jgi:hypothetical protein
MTNKQKQEEKKKYVFKAFGIYTIGYELSRLEWAIATINNCEEIGSFLSPFRVYELVSNFEDIGKEARGLHDQISKLGKQAVPDSTKDKLRAVVTKWDTLMRERLHDLYLVTPQCTINAKRMMEGIDEILGEEDSLLLEEIEESDLDEACKCILIGSPTAGEHIALRAAESLLRRWYINKTGETLKYGTWGAVLNKLVKLFPEKKRPKEIALLGYLKERRDEVAHPERVSELSEAETTLMNVCTLIRGLRPVLTTSPTISLIEASALASKTEDKKVVNK